MYNYIMLDFLAMSMKSVCYSVIVLIRQLRLGLVKESENCMMHTHILYTHSCIELKE